MKCNQQAYKGAIEVFQLKDFRHHTTYKYEHQAMRKIVTKQKVEVKS